MKKPRVIVILGPTATGKSALGILLAKLLGTEIISGDSMLVYRSLNIGTAKPSAEELAAVPHHLVDILSPQHDFNVVEFKSRADYLIKKLNNEGKIPIVVGGTGLYLKALLEDYTFNPVEENAALRLQLEDLAAKEGNGSVYRKLEAVAPQEAARLHPNDLRRVIRALESTLAGTAVSREKETSEPYDAAVLGLTLPREILYRRIEERVEAMINEGLFEETAAVLASGVPAGAQALRSIGYKQAVEYLSGLCGREEAIKKMQQYTRNFAKRQVTWYKKMPYIKWFAAAQTGAEEEKLAALAGDFIEEKFKLR